MPEKQIMIRKADGQMEAFDVAKLGHSLQHTTAKPELIEQVIAETVKNVEEGMTTHEIYKHAFSALHNLERPAAIRYSMRRSVMSLGPSGFPFERFVAEIFKTEGYEAMTDQTVLGSCVEHEIDVVAWNKNKLIMSEVKFHNQLGLKSDLKVVLYVKARFEDLADTVFNYGGIDRKLNEGWLITNTKFTLSAIKYAECKNLKIIGWNYPIGAGLKEMIDNSKLHPLTILNSLSEHDKKQLLEKNIVLCSTLKQNPNHLQLIGLNEANIQTVLDEIKLIEVS